MNLSVIETPESTNQIYSTPQQWIAVNNEPAGATEAFQAALNAKQPLVYLPVWPVHSYLINSTVFVGVDTTHILGMQSTLESCGVQFEDPLTPTAVLEISDRGQYHRNLDPQPMWIENLNFFQYTDNAVVCGYHDPAGSIAIDHRSSCPHILRYVSLGGVGHLGIHAT